MRTMLEMQLHHGVSCPKLQRGLKAHRLPAYRGNSYPAGVTLTSEYIRWSPGVVGSVRVKHPKESAISKHVTLYDPREQPNNAHYIEVCTEPYSCTRPHMTWGEFKEHEYPYDGY